jgi:hypothetical protein
MAAVFVHSKYTVLMLNGVDLSGQTTTSQVEQSADTHDVTGYGNNSHVFSGGLGNGAVTFGGNYDSTAITGPRAVIKPLIGSTVEFIRRPEGTGAGKPQDRLNVIVTKYVETAPVADMVTWSCDAQPSGDFNLAAQ